MEYIYVICGTLAAADIALFVALYLIIKKTNL